LRRDSSNAFGAFSFIIASLRLLPRAANASGLKLRKLRGLRAWFRNNRNSLLLLTLHGSRAVGLIRRAAWLSADMKNKELERQLLEGQLKRGGCVSVLI
jgi:hypothetical protein